VSALAAVGVGLGGAVIGLVLYGPAARIAPARRTPAAVDAADDPVEDVQGTDDVAAGGETGEVTAVAPPPRSTTGSRRSDPDPGPDPDPGTEGETHEPSDPAVSVTAAAGPPGGPAEEPPPDSVPGHPPLTLSGRLGAAAVTGVLCAALAVRFGPVPVLAAFVAFCCGGIALSVTDIRVGLIPVRILYPTLAAVSAGLVGAALADGDWHDLWVAAVAGVVVFVVFFAIWWVAPRGMGFGDVRLSGVCGLVLGWLGPLHVYVGLLCSFAVGVLWGVAVMVVRGGGRRTRFAFGPALVAGTMVGLLWGGTVIHAWLGHGS
jgi:leader peptidase (prepilin peptidase)/N-methyltransferase